MTSHQQISGDASIERHLDNLAENLQFIADLGYGDVALVVPHEADQLRVIADARPMTAVAASSSTRAGRLLARADEPEACEALSSGARVRGESRRTTRGISYATAAYPVGPSASPYAVIVRDIAQQVLEAPGKMETVFMQFAEELLDVFSHGPLEAIDSGEPFSTSRVAGDGVLRVAADGLVTYASPNAVNIMRLAGVEGFVSGVDARQLPGAATAIVPLLAVTAAKALEFEAGGRVLGYRTIGTGDGAIVLVEDVTEARRREQELKVKEATIREVHHRVKNNLQTIASLLRIQGRRSDSEETRRALAEAMERVSSMAVVHDLLAGSTEELIDFTEAAVIVVDMVRRGLAGENPNIALEVTGSTGQVPAHVATSLALAIAELVHNAIEHGVGERRGGRVDVTMRRLPSELVLTVRDDGAGVPEGFDPDSDANLGLEIVRTIVRDDLQGTLTFSHGRGTTVTVRFPLPAEEV